jgi:hypothetical protein
MKTITLFDRDYILHEDGRLYDIEKKAFKKVSTNGKRGYLQYSFHHDMKTTSFLVHRLVATHYVFNPNGLPVVNHKDGNKLNCHWNNLEWCSYSDNIKHAISNGLIRKRSRPMLSHTIRKGVQLLDEKGNVIAQFASMTIASRITGVSKNLISKVCTGKQKTTNNQVWKFNA